MSNNPFAIANPFEPTALDEKTELRALLRALQFAQGFKLLFARCNQPDQSQRLVADLRAELPQLTVREIHFSKPITHLLDALSERLAGLPSDAVFVSGLEYSLPTAANAHATPFVANLNAARNSFPQVIPCPLVLWVPEYVLTAIAYGAPDFFSIRSGAYFFAATPHDTADLARSLTAGEEWIADNLTLTEKQERIAAIASLLADYKAQAPKERDRRTEISLHRRLGNLLLALGSYTAALQHCERTLTLAGELSDREWKGLALMNLGNIYSRQGRWAEAEGYYRQSLEIRRECGGRASEGITLTNLGIVYSSQGRWAEAEENYRQSLAILRESGDRVGEGQTLTNLGNVYYEQGRWAEAEGYYRQSLEIKRECGGRVSEGITLTNLGLVYSRQGRWAEAEASYQQSLAIMREYGYRVNEGKTLENLALLREAQGDMTGALAFEQEALRVLETTEDEAAKEKARELVAKWEGRG